ncbi:FAD-binding protein [Streptomyces sp. NPDC094437]|uniref:FAD-binding protein n=1 Tax=Streptomyces sp. NPDC094437 TaxID=3366060 RepID=UPI003813FA60
MVQIPSRHTVLRGLAGTGAAVIGFDPFTRSWAAADATGAHGPLAHVPPLDGTLATDAPSLDAAADDYGHHVHHRPLAVLRPGSVADVVAMIRFCNTHGLPIAPRGQGHGTFGQAQVDGGLVIETSTLAGIGPVTRDRTVTVGAGVKWSALAKATLAHGLTPPVFTDYLELSVGGTLAVGGLGGQTHQHGAQVDNVTALQVVTGAGEPLTCSPTRHADLFEATLAGLGQCSVIVGATLTLVPAPDTVRHYLLPYDDLETYLDDQRRLAEDRRFAYLEGQVTADASGAFSTAVLEAAAYGPPAGPAPDDTALLDGLRHTASGAQISDVTYGDFLDRLAPTVAALKESGVWAYAHPWLNLLIPGDSVAATAGAVLADLTEADLGAGLVLLYPLTGARLTTPLLRTPDDPMPYLLALLRAVPATDTAAVDRLLTANRKAYDTVAAAGGTQYPVGSLPFTRADWRHHYGAAWPQLAAAKATYDPKALLVPGRGIFQTT